MRWIIAATLVMVGCAPASDPCAGQPGVCIALDVHGPFVDLDELNGVIAVPGGVELRGRETIGGPIRLPVRFAALLPNSLAGSVTVQLWGMSGGATVAYGEATTDIPPTHQRLSIVLSPVPPGCGSADDPRNCGICGNDCAALPGVAVVSCQAGQCVIAACVAGRAHCTSNSDEGCETDIESPAHCGACDVTCAATAPLCAASGGELMCVAACGGATPTQCDQSCVDTTSDIHNCGGCGHECVVSAGASPSCAQSTCGTICQSDNHLCAGRCVADNSVQSCGASCTPCVAPANGTATCDGSQCGFECIAGFVSSSTGCIATTVPCGAGTHECGGQCVSSTSTSSCGTSCTPCVPPANATATCDGTQCGFQCVPGFTPSGQVCVVGAVVWSPETSGTEKTLSGVWGSGSGDVYVVGSSGTILHSTGNGVWTPQTSGTTDGLSGVWGSGSGDVYVVGGTSTILHSSGDGVWTPQTNGATNGLSGVWGSGSGDVYAVGGVGTILHSAGNGAWTLLSSGTTSAIIGAWGSGSGDIYAVGNGVGTTVGSFPNLLHSTGNGAWTSQTTDALRSVWGSGSKDVYAFGAGGTIQHSTGNGVWASQQVFISNLQGGWGSGSADVYAVGDSGTVGAGGAPGGTIMHSTGNDAWTWQTIGTNAFTGIWGSGSTDIYDVGIYGTILHGQ